MQRQVFVLRLFAILLLYSTSNICWGQSSRPNVVMIAVDDMNDWVSCLNDYQSIQTPNIDRLAKMGTLFTNAYCATPLVLLFSPV